MITSSPAREARAVEQVPGDTMQAQRRPHDVWFGVVLLVFTVPLVIAIVNDAALTWDGAWYLFRMLDTGRPFIAHDRLIDASLHWPVLWVESLTDSLAILRATFGAIHVVTPLVSLALSWWVVRKDAPGLIIWPLLGIGLATLPGQINFISEGIKAHQLIWPVLLAVLIGLPARTLPMAAMVSLVIMYLHPAAVPIFVAVAAAALVMAYLRRLDRERLVPFATCLIIAALLRYGMIAGGYESGEMNIETQKRQWLNSATGLPGVALLLTFATSVVLLGTSSARSTRRWVWAIPVTMVALAGGVLTIWAMDPTRWWDALEFRGPTNVISLTAAGFAFVDATQAHLTSSSPLRNLQDIRRRTGQAIAIAFAIVLSIQSVEYGRVIDDMNGTLAASNAQCLSLSSMPDMPESPLNLWSTPSLSLLYQGWTPTQVILQEGECDRAVEDGSLAIAAPGTAYDSTRIDLVPLQWQLGGHGACWWDETDGWHPAEITGIGRRRWSAGSGTIRLFVGEPTTISFTGEMVSFSTPNTVQVIVNSDVRETLSFSSEPELSMNILSLELARGENIVEFVTANDPGRAPGDARKLAFSLLNVEPVPLDGATCSYRP